MKFLVAVAGAIALMCVPRTTSAVVYYVDSSHPQAGDGNDGSIDRPWLTIQHAADTAQAGDTVYVHSGTYDERVDVPNSGGAGSTIDFVAVGNVSMQGFDISGQQYIRIIGFEITGMPQGSGDWGIYLHTAHGCEIWNNYIHDIPGGGIRMHNSGGSDQVVIKGNTLAYLQNETEALIGINVYGANNLVEYNDISHVFDYVRLFGENNIVRNNYFHDSFWSEFPGVEPHIDGVQHFTGDWYPRTILHNLIECNYMYNVPDQHTHFVMLSDTQEMGSSDLIFRRNVARYLGSYLLLDEQVDNVRVFHNTVVDVHMSADPKGWYCLSFTSEALGGKVQNNIFFNASRDGGNSYSVAADSETGFAADFNLAFNNFCGASCTWRDPIASEPNAILNQDPLFADYEQGIFYLQAGSPAVDAGGPLTVTVAAGSGTEVDVEEAGYFMDGWAMTRGDSIIVGTNQPVRVTGVDYDTERITVDGNISWNAGDPVNLAYGGNGPDIGAVENDGNADATFGVAVTDPQPDELVGGVVDIQAQVANSQNVRHVVFFVNGVPIDTVYDGPYQAAWIASDMPFGVYTLSACAYALHASMQLFQCDEISVIVGDPNDTTPPTAPLNLTAEAVSSSRVDLWWDAATDDVMVVEYRVFRDGTEIARTNQLTYTDETVEAGTTYTYTVRALDVGGNLGPSSNEAVVEVPGEGGGGKDGCGCRAEGGSAGDGTVPVLALLLLVVGVIRRRRRPGRRKRRRR